MTPFALLLAQHGELDGVDRLLELRGSPAEGQLPALPDSLLTAIALTQSPKYLPQLKALTEASRTDYELRKVLRALSGMSGAEAGQLRAQVSKRMRTPAPGIRLE